MISVPDSKCGTGRERCLRSTNQEASNENLSYTPTAAGSLRSVPDDNVDIADNMEAFESEDEAVMQDLPPESIREGDQVAVPRKIQRGSTKKWLYFFRQ